MPKIKPIHYKILVKMFEKEKFIYSRTKGDHIIYIKTGINRPIVIPMYSEVPVFVIKNLLRTAGISREQYLKLIGK
ncbi:type II toxin-antitoxin system HicA family toxin [Patescibacteria group bacterium]